MKKASYIDVEYGSVSEFHVGASSPAFCNQARRLLQIKQATYYTHGHKHGKLDMARVWRAGMPPIDSGDWNSRIFKKKRSNGDITDTAIQVLTDWSGSMGGTKAQCGAQAAGLLNDAFSRVLHIPLEILAFTTNGSRPIIGIIKPFSKGASADQVAQRFHSFLTHMSGNNDADSIQFAYARLVKRKEKRKILIVLSDGCPADGVGDPVYALKTVVQDIESKGIVEIYGIGIMDYNVKRFYSRHRIVKAASEIGPCLIELLTDALK